MEVSEMLVLSRKEGQAVSIGDCIILKVVKVEGNRVRLGIEAPDHVRILRSELLEWHDLQLDDAEGDHQQNNPSVSSVDFHILSWPTP
jgi:carbon storage regulator